jgi:SNF2 family DNA or RNA helicase
VTQRVGLGMVASSSEFQTKILRKNIVPDEYKLYRAALEWDLTDPIVIETRKDLKSEKRWQDQLRPYHHQVANLITFCRRLPVTLLADDVGLGKTISAGLVASELISRASIQNPDRLPEAARATVAGRIENEIRHPLRNRRRQKTDRGRTRRSRRRDHDLCVGAPAPGQDPEDRFQMLVLDEAHKLRNLYGVDPPPQVAVRFKKALEERRFRYVLMLTATPIQNRLWDLYSLVDLLTVARGHQNPFGSEGMFARKFIADNRGQARQLKADAREEFRSIVYGYMSRVRRGSRSGSIPHDADPQPATLESCSSS